MIVAQDNFLPPRPLKHSPAAGEAGFTHKRDLPKDIYLDVRTWLEKSPSNHLFSLFADEGKRNHKNDGDALIVALEKRGEQYVIRTGNYVGRFTHDGVVYDIQSRFGDVFLQRMLNYVNDIYVDDVELLGRRVDKQPLDYTRLILFYLFAQSLEKAYLLGFPKAYHSVDHRDATVRGRIDMNRYIRHDIPFLGKVSSTSREQGEVQPIIDVLAKAVQVIEKAGARELLEHIGDVRAHLKEKRSKSFVSAQLIEQAKSAKALSNPVYSGFKRVIALAEAIIRAARIEEDHQGKSKNYGHLVNVAELFEIYVSKLLQRRFPAWRVSSPAIALYQDNFYARRIIPDIVMELDEHKVAVFDTKYKRMNFQGNNQFGPGDLDRLDFFQINSYMAYYRQQDKQVVAGGLLYPLELEIDVSYCRAPWMDSGGTHFVVDGIQVPDGSPNQTKSLADFENDFIQRIQEVLS
jgi:5-methylcytosine-specific restriction endonuclease McrBC regulatory subunit McrC